MTWECPRCGSVYPDSDGGLPDEAAADDKDGCLMCHEDPNRVYRETYGDDSPRGEQYLDDRTELAYAYDGCELIAIAYSESVVEEWTDDAWFLVELTPAGEARCGEGGESA